LKKNKGYTLKQLEMHASGEFACHKTCELTEDDETGGGTFTPRKGSVHCAGALIFLEKRDRPHQMMRICERLGMYDRSKLDMEAEVR
jgi:hypothetical protein